MPRIRKTLIDNTLGKIFTNIQTISSANASNIIAGTKLQSKNLNTGRSIRLRTINNLGNSGFYFPTDSLLTTVTLRLHQSSKAPTKLRFRAGSSISSTVIIADNVTIPANTLLITVDINAFVDAGNYVYVDITETSPFNSATGYGLGLSLNYYST
jgi:hypothetical protein